MGELRKRLRKEGVRGHRGFTLVELAIVLVIIGLILGAVLKGQDLINNAHAKRLVSEVRKWEVVLWTYYDRHQRFPSDGSKLGGLRDQVKTLHNFGGQLFRIGFTNTNGTEVIVVCPVTENDNDTCTSVNNNKIDFFLKNLDLSIDGEKDIGSGLVRAFTGSVNIDDNGTANGTLNISTSSGTNSFSHKNGAVYLLDSQAFDDTE